MPSYDFRCPECDERFEVTRPAGGATDISCPVCDAPAKRVFTPVGVVFKGSGFHNTDYRPRQKSEAAASSSEATAAAKDTPACPGGDGGGCAGCPAAS